MFIQSDFLRRLYFKAAKTYARSALWTSGKKILINSVPKAGTHMVTSVMQGLPQLMPAYRHIRMPELVSQGLENEDGGFNVDLSRVHREFSPVRPGQFCSGHMFYNSDLDNYLGDNGFKTLFIIRDPRDVVISRYNYILGLKRHPLHDFFKYELKDKDRILDVCISGFRDVSKFRKAGRKKFTDSRLLGVAEQYKKYAGWISSKNCLVLKFEDLRGAGGGGSDQLRFAKFNKALQFVGVDIEEQLLRNKLCSKKSQKSATFHKGDIGGWSKYLSADNVDLLGGLWTSDLDCFGYSINVKK